MSVDTPRWVRDAVFYQVFPDRFARSGRVAAPGPLEPWDAPPTSHGFKGGDLLGIVDRLDHLADLGVTALYLTPIFASASNHRYHTDDYLAVDPLLGGDAALRELLDACHGRGMRVVLDGVFNHVGRGFWPFHHVVENGAQSPYRTWFHLDPDVLEGRRGLRPYPTGEDWRQLGDLEPAEHHSGRASRRVLGYQAWWDLPALPKLNTDEPAVRNHLFAVAEHWLRFGIDGWRLDVPMEIADDDFWREFRRRVRAVNPEAYIVGEIWNEAHRYLQGDMFDAVMDYPLAEAILGFAAGRHLDLAVAAEQHELGANVRPLDAPGFAARLEHLLSLYDPHVVAVQLNLLDSHDTPRFLTMAGGDRDALRLATLLQMTLPGAPCIYYGDEVGVEGHHDPDCRRSFPWDRDRWDTKLLASIRAAIELRSSQPVLRHGRFRTLAAAGSVLAFGRLAEAGRGDIAGPGGVRPGGMDANHDDEAGAIVVAINAGDLPARLDAEVPDLAGVVLEPVAGWPAHGRRPEVTRLDRGRLVVEVPARDAVVLRSIHHA